MGIILSRVRKKKSAEETLEKLENDIKKVEENKHHAQLRYKKITKLFLVYSLGLYIICGLFLYFNFNSTWKEKLLYLVPLALSPLLLYVIKKIITWHYTYLINKNQKKLNEMKKEKKRILDEVMDKETYKVAKQILDKYSSDGVLKSNQNIDLTIVNQPNEGLKKRIVSVSNTVKTDFSKAQVKNSGYNPSVHPINANLAPSKPMPSMPQQRLPAPVFSMQRSYVDKVVEYLIGDGPNNRYALICSRCHSHNGMALKEEFEYIGFKCYYCFYYNPARKIRPEAPKLEAPMTKETDSDSDSQKSENNSDSEQKPLVEITELDDSANLGKNLENNKSSDKKDDDVNSANPAEESIKKALIAKDFELDNDKNEQFNDEGSKRQNSIKNTLNLTESNMSYDESELKTDF